MRQGAFVVLILLTLAAAAAGCGDGQGSRSQAAGKLTAVRHAVAVRHFRDPLGWSVAYPGTMYLERSRSPSFVDITVVETTVASFRMRAPIQASQTKTGTSMRVYPPRDQEGLFPADGIAFRVYQQDGGPGPDFESSESHFPLRLSSFHRSSNYGDLGPAPLERLVVADGRDYTVYAWIGPKASATERATLERVVAALSFPRLQVGETVGYGFRVFAQASRYPVGSFTPVRVQGQPFYLVHAPGGWYAVGWKWESLTGGYKSRCRLRLDRASRQFFCTNMHARWDRVGRVLVKPATARRGDPLNLTVAKLAWDGHVLLTPDTARFADGRYAHQLWPNVYPHGKAGS